MESTARAAATALLLALSACGCLTSAPPQPKSWIISAPRRYSAEVDVSRTTRLGPVSVAAPYDRPALAVKRADGSIAFDAYNVFSAAPSALLRAPISALIDDSGRFGRVLPQSSTARFGSTLEVVVTDLSLDCREEGRRMASVELSIAVVEGREVKMFLDGSGTADASSGDYSAAFSEAFGKAVSAALEHAPER